MTLVSLKTGPTLDECVEAAINTVLGLIRQGFSMALTASSGKDSTTSTLLSLEAIRRAKLEGLDQAVHFISSSSTGVENPEVEDNLLTMHADIERFADLLGLPVEVHMVHPSLSSKFTVATIGRGTLPRFIENGQANRQCAVDWKRKPQERLARELAVRSLSHGFKETITVLGTRREESTVRSAAMARRRESAAMPVRSAEGFLTLSLIADWSEDMVWDFLAMFLLPDTAPFPAFADQGAIRRMLDLYRDGNSGTCGMFLNDGQRAPCGARFGCVTCTVVGPRDKSMESLLDSDPRYEYLRGLNDFRQFLLNTQWDLNRRELIGRTLSPTGHLAVRPDVYSLRMRRDLLEYMLTLDELERERAEQLDADLAMGLVESTPRNERMRYPQFELVSISDIALIDWYWSMHPYAGSAFPALSIWFDIKTLGRRFKVPKLEMAPPVPIPEKRWFHVGAFDAQAPTDGLRDYGAEMWNPYLHPERPLANRWVDGDRTVWFEEAEGLEVDASKACEVIETFCTTPMAIEAGHHGPMESARFWLNEEVIKLPAGMAGRYQHMAKRGQYFAHLAERLNIAAPAMDSYLLQQSITDQQHEALLALHAQAAKRQFDLFEA